MRDLLKEPLLHFVIIGFLIFGLYSVVNEESGQENIIVIDDAEYDYLLGLWKNQWQREPNEDDIRAFIDQYLRQEVFYKEALAMNLDHNDLIVKRRLSQKMEAVSNDLNAMVKSPTEKDLQKFYEANKSLFLEPQKFTFRQVLFLNEENNLEQEIEKSREILGKTSVIPAPRRTKLSLPNDWEDISISEVQKAFGNDFANALNSAPLNKWVGPIASGFGQHLVFISFKGETYIPDYNEIKPYIQKEYEYQTELETQEQVYLDLLEKYEVKITSESVPQKIKKSYSR